MGFRVRGEPRQPQKHKGAVVHTEQTPGYDDSLTQDLIHDAIMGEARASQALTKEMQGTMPSVASNTDKREEPTMPKGNDGLPNGRQGKDIAHAITTYCKVGQTFKAEQVWQWLGEKKRSEWVRAYGGRDKAFSKVKVALNNLNYSGRLGLERSVTAAGVFQYTGKTGEPSDAYKRTIATRNKRKKAQAPKVPVDKPVSKPVTVAKPTSAVPEYEGYRFIGFDTEGTPLYIEHATQRAGYVNVVVSFVAV